MDELSGSRRGETREFWEAAVRLWKESGLSVRTFCRNEGLTEHAFYSWRRELLPKTPPSGENQASSATKDDTIIADQLQTPKRKRTAGTAGSDTSSVKFMPVRVVAENMDSAQSAPAEAAAGASSIELVHRSDWRVRIPDGFAPATLAAVLTVLERRSC